MIIRDSDCVNADLPKFDWTRIAISQVFYLFSISDSWTHSTFLSFQQNIGPWPSLLYLGSFSNPRDMQDLLQSNTAFGLDILLVYTLSQNNFWTTPFFFKMYYVLVIFSTFMDAYSKYYNVQEFSNVFKNVQKTNNNTLKQGPSVVGYPLKIK